MRTTGSYSETLDTLYRKNAGQNRKKILEITRSVSANLLVQKSF